MRKKILALSILLITTFSFVYSYNTDNNNEEILGARSSGVWNVAGGNYITMPDNGYNILVNGINRYINFNSISGISGYGFRDNAGTIEYKSSGGDWAEIGTGGAIIHNDLADIQGGTTDEYYHLTSSEYTGTGTGDFVRENSPSFTGDVGIGTTEPSQKLTVSGGDIQIDNTTFANQDGIIYKGSTPFIHNFNYGDNGTVTTAGQNIFIGENAGNLTMGSTATEAYHASSNSFIGNAAGYSNTTGYHNSFIGNNAGYSNTTGDKNSFIGNTAGYSNTTGYRNSFIGSYAGYSNTTGYYNSFIGNAAGYFNTTGHSNSFIGNTAGYTNTTGYSNSFIGNFAGRSNTTGYFNSFIGSYAGYANTTGYANSFIGNTAGRYIADGSTANQTGYNNTFIGYNTKALADGDTNETVIGYNATGIGSNSVVLGNDSVTKTVLKGNVGIGTTEPLYSLDVDEIGNSSGDLKIQPDVQGNVVLFGDTDVGDDVNGKMFKISRKAAEGDRVANFYWNQLGNFIMQAEGDSNTSAMFDVTNGGKILFAQNSQDGAQVRFGSSYKDVNVPFQYYGYITADTTPKYVQFKVDDTGDTFKLTRQDSYINGFEVDMPVFMNDNVGIGTTNPNQKLTVEGTMSLKEQASADADTSGYGQIWVKSGTPNELWFTDDAGTDISITEKTKCIVIENLAAADDNISFGALAEASTITSVWCNYSGTGTTVAQISLEDGAGNAMTHTTPTCSAQATVATAQSVTAGNTLTARELLAFDVDNTVSPETDTYTICVSYK
jgi:hypothetical protein